MSEFQSEITVNAPADQVFRVIAVPENMPLYLPYLREAEAIGDGRVRVSGELNGQPYSGEGYLNVDGAAKRVEWSAATWTCSLEVDGDHATSTVRMRISFSSDRADAAESIHTDLERTLLSIQNVVEGKGRKVEHDTHGATHSFQEPVIK